MSSNFRIEQQDFSFKRVRDGVSVMERSRGKSFALLLRMDEVVWWAREALSLWRGTENGRWVRTRRC